MDPLALELSLTALQATWPTGSSSLAPSFCFFSGLLCRRCYEKHFFSC